MATNLSTYERLLQIEAKERLDPFWGHIHHQLDMIEASKPTRAHEVITLLDGSAGSAFFGGSGGDRELLVSLHEAGWDTTEYNAWYFWTATHPETGDSLEYIEGDVYNRTNG